MATDAQGSALELESLKNSPALAKQRGLQVAKALSLPSTIVEAIDLTKKSPKTDCLRTFVQIS